MASIANFSSRPELLWYRIITGLAQFLSENLNVEAVLQSPCVYLNVFPSNIFIGDTILKKEKEKTLI